MVPLAFDWSRPVSGRVDGVDGERVRRAAAEAVERVAAGRRAVRTGGVAAAVEVVARDADVVSRGVPAQGQRRLRLAARPRDRRERTGPACPRGRRRRWRRGRGRRAADRSVHVALDLARRQGAVVDAHVVELAAEPLLPDRVAAEAERSRRGGDAAGVRARVGDAAVDVEPHRRAVIGDGEVAPGVQRQRRRADGILLAVDVHLADRPGGILARVQRVGDAAVAFLGDNRAPAAECDGSDPRLDGHSGAEVERRRVGHRDPVVDSVERESTLVLAGTRPGRA